MNLRHIEIFHAVYVNGSVSAAARALGLTQPTVSHHLKVLMDAGFLTRSKRGTWAYYRLAHGSLDTVAVLLAGV